MSVQINKLTGNGGGIKVNQATGRLIATLTESSFTYSVSTGSVANLTLESGCMYIVTCTGTYKDVSYSSRDITYRGSLFLDTNSTSNSKHFFSTVSISGGGSSNLYEDQSLFYYSEGKVVARYLNPNTKFTGTMKIYKISFKMSSILL